MTNTVPSKTISRTTLTARHGKCGCGMREKILSGELPPSTQHSTPNGACQNMIWPEHEDVLLDELQSTNN